jgi:hypothetical protein
MSDDEKEKEPEEPEGPVNVTLDIHDGVLGHRAQDFEEVKPLGEERT